MWSLDRLCDHFAAQIHGGLPSRAQKLRSSRRLRNVRAFAVDHDAELGRVFVRLLFDLAMQFRDELRNVRGDFSALFDVQHVVLGVV
ncbi:hypothetical protein GY166_30605 [Burkholderia multivorans]|uniref:hypothetical protein n=1 Tax=Burkholderia multivorans TaxID=87883 RepID=UPI0019D6CB2E|nr:hypothetical protein [Burkholderia multivorans]MBN8173516.1 hypothetical protein [Burkholderia multivorans]